MKSKFKRVRAQSGIGNDVNPNQFGVTDPNAAYIWGNRGAAAPINPADMPFNPELDYSGTPVEQGKVIQPADQKFMVGTGRYRDNPYVAAFNVGASAITGVANIIQNNKLKNKENAILTKSLEPAYMENMEGEGLNNLPMYTQYGGGQETGFAHDAFYGDISIPSGGGGYKAGGKVFKYATGGGPSIHKAKEILRDGTINGQPLTDKQKRYFGWIAGGKKQTGGGANPAPSPNDPAYAELQKKYNLRQTTPEQRRDWNMFSAFAKSRGYTKGSTELDTGKKGDVLFEEYRKENPNTTITRDLVPSVQAEMLQLKQSAQGLSRRQGLPGAENVMNWASGIDNIIGDQTVYSTYPDAEYREYQGGTLTSQQYLGLTDANLTPEMKAQRSAQMQQQPGQPKFLTISGKPIPAGVKIERGADGGYYYENRDGDLVQVQQQKKAGGTVSKMKYCKTGGNKYHNGGDHAVPEGSHRMPDGSIMSNDEMPEIYGVPDEYDQYADVEAESGEVIEKQNGQIVKVANNANTHEQGGEMIPNVKRVLEDTSSKRKDKASKALKVDPKEIEQVLGFKPKSATSHAKVFEQAKKELGKTNKLYSDANKGANQLEEMNKTTLNSLKLNDMFQRQLPDEQELFDLLYDHQEGVKLEQGINDDGSMKKWGGKYKAQAGTGVKRLSRNFTPAQRAEYVYDEATQMYYKKGEVPTATATQPAGPDLGLYRGPKTQSQESTYSPTGKTTEAKLSDQSILDAYKAAGINLGNVRGKELQSSIYNYIIDNQPDVLRSILKEYGPTNLAEKKKLDKLKAFTDPDNATPEDLRAALPGLLDALPGARLPIPTISQETQQDQPQTGVTPGQRPPLNTGVTVNPRIVQQPQNKFYEPTYWSDIAAPTAALVDAFRRDPELYNPAEFHQLRYKLLDPTAALVANQADYNAAVAGSDEFTGGTGVGNANRANMLGQKYRANAQILGQYANQNVGIKNQEIAYNTQVRDKQSVADQQARGSFYRNVQLAREAQRQQILTSVGQLARVDQLKRRQNVSGNLIQKLSPAFNQFGEYNGFQYIPYVDPSVVNYNEFSTNQGRTTTPSRTTTTETWKTPAGRVIKKVTKQ